MEPSRLSLTQIVSAQPLQPSFSLPEGVFKRKDKLATASKKQSKFRPSRLMTMPKDSFNIVDKHRSLRLERSTYNKSRLNASTSLLLPSASESPTSIKQTIKQLHNQSVDRLLQHVKLPEWKPSRHSTIEEIFKTKVKKSLGQSRMILHNLANHPEARSIIHASLSKRSRIIEAFIDAAPNDKERVEVVSTVDQYRRTSLHYTAFYGLKQVMQMLLTAGADPRHIDIFGRTCLHYAALNDDKSIVEVIFQNLKAARDNRDRACEVTNQNTVAQKLKYLNLITLLPKTELSIVIGRLEDFEERRVTVDLYDLDDEIKKALAKMEYSAEQLVSPAKGERTPFDTGRYVDLQDEMGRSALHIASMNGAAGVVRTLLELGADPNLEDIQNERPVDLTRSQEVTQLLLQRGNLVGPNKSRPTTARNKQLEPRYSKDSKKMDVRDLRIMPIEEIQRYYEGELRNSLLM
jgi:ankyrin repeat protein